MATDEEKLVSLSGAPIEVHAEHKRSFEPAIAGPDHEVIEAHIERHFGAVDFVFHELVSDLVHIDVHHVPPRRDRNVHTLVTTGMSDLPMKTPEQARDCGYAELVVVLPPEWPVSQAAFEDEDHYWPIRLLKFLARLPHVHDTWLWEGHTVPNGDPAEPYAPSTRFAGAILVAPLSVPSPARTLEVSGDKTVSFFTVLPLYAEEMDLKLRKGAAALFDRLDAMHVTDVIEIGRKNGGRAWWKPFGPSGRE